MQHLQIESQLQEKRKLIVQMLWDAHWISEREKELRAEFLSDLFRLKLLDDYKPINMREIDARFEYDNDEYKDRSFLETRKVRYDEMETLVGNVVSEGLGFGLVVISTLVWRRSLELFCHLQLFRFSIFFLFFFFFFFPRPFHSSVLKIQRQSKCSVPNREKRDLDMNSVLLQIHSFTSLAALY